MHEIHVAKYKGPTTSVTVFGGPTCRDCPSQDEVAGGVDGLALADLLTENEVYHHLTTTCHRCLAEGEANLIAPGHWEIHLLAYADHPDAPPMPADGGVL